MKNLFRLRDALAILMFVLAGDPLFAETVTEPSGYRLDGYRAPVPATLTGARVIGGEEARRLLETKSAIFIDVYPRPPKPANLPTGTLWRDTPHESLPGALWLPNTGHGALSSELERTFKARLDRLTSGDRGKALVFFCEADCWMSWNAAKRALEYGYHDVLWFRDGTNAWLDLGEELVNVEPEGAVP